MDVFLVPLPVDRYELYCEVPDEPHDVSAEPPRGFGKRLTQRFRGMLAEAERERRHGRAQSPHGGWAARVKSRVMRWVAEAVAEQRLLWHLRRQPTATLHFPDDMAEDAAVRQLREQLARDFDRHRFWLAIDSLLFVGSGVFFFVPGPNVIAYYFAFRMVGHFLSLRGARHGLGGVEWRHQASGPLATLRGAVTLDPAARERAVQGVAEALSLEHLPRFVERTAVYFNS